MFVPAPRPPPSDSSRAGLATSSTMKQTPRGRRVRPCPSSTAFPAGIYSTAFSVAALTTAIVSGPFKDLPVSIDVLCAVLEHRILQRGLTPPPSQSTVMAVTRKTAPRAGGCRWLARRQTIVRSVGGRPGGADRFFARLSERPRPPRRHPDRRRRDD